MFDFNNKKVLVTGAGAGIGSAVAKAFYQAGAKVGLNSVSDSAKAVVNELLSLEAEDGVRRPGSDAVFFQADVSKSKQVSEMVRQMAEIFGGIDAVVNCAGIVTGGNVEETGEEAWNRTMSVNATGTFLVCKYALPYLRRSKGVIVNVSSLVAVKGIANRAAYSASKGTVLSPSLEARIASEPDPEAAYRQYVSRQAMGRLGRAEEIAAAVLFSASGEVGFMNGANIMVDGAASL